MALFTCYDSDGSGTISYREFGSNIFGFEVGAKKSDNTNDELLAKL